MQYDLLIKNVRVVRPNEHSTPAADIGIKDEKLSSVGNDLDVKNWAGKTLSTLRAHLAEAQALALPEQKLP